MANQNYQQTEMDLRTNLQQDVDCRVASVIDDTYDMLKDYNPARRAQPSRGIRHRRRQLHPDQRKGQVRSE